MTFKHKLDHRLALLRGVVAAAALLAACEKPLLVTSPGSPATLQVTPKNITLYPAQTTDFMAVGLTATGDTAMGISVNWSVTGGTLVGTSTNGGRHYGQYKSGNQFGVFRAIASSGGTSDTASVTVSQVPVASVMVSPATASILVGRTVELTSTPKDANGNVLTGRTVTWTSSNGGVATVNGTGLVTAVAAGMAIVTAACESSSGTAAITTTNVPVASVTVSPATASIQGGQTVQLTATPRDSNGTPLTGRAIVWSSSAQAVATVGGSGLVTGVATGAATITATSEGRSGTSAITVTLPAPVASVTVTPASLSLPVPQAGQLTATVRDAVGNVLTGRLVTWATSAPAVATVSTGGMVTAQGVGTATITATSEGRSGSAMVTVTPVQALYPNQPAGAIPMLQWATDFSSVVAAASETDSQPWTFVNDLGLPSRLVWATTVTDPNAPVNPTKVGRLEINPTNDNYPTYGVSIQDLHSIRKFIPPPTASKLYWSYWFKYLPGFTTEAYQFKQTEMFYGNNQGLHIIATNGSTTEPWQLEFVNAGASSLERVGGAMTVFTNTWYQVEVIITYATRHEQMFVNGRPYIDYIGNATNWPSGAPAEFGYVWVYGGIGGSQLTTSIYAYWDTIYMSYVP